MPDANRTAMRRYYDEVWQQGNLAAEEELVAEDMVDHMPGPIPGRAGHRNTLMMIANAFPDRVFTVHDMFAEGDKVAGHWTMYATHTGELMGIPPTGKRVELHGMDIARWRNGQIAEFWHIEDIMGLMRQLGVAAS